MLNSLFLFFIVASALIEVSNGFQKSLGLDNVAIVGGHNASIEEFPHQVLFMYQIGVNIYDCGAFIVSENYVLTAAHCVAGVQPSQVNIFAGSTCPLKNKDYTKIGASDIKAHPKYTNGTLDCDVAIIKTDKPIKFSKSVQPIKLPPEGRAMKDGSMIAVSGWGTTKENGRPSECLLAIEVPVVNSGKCQKDYAKIHVKTTENMFCAGLEETGGKDACQGDSGGAAVQDGMVVGVVSFGYGCAQPHYPGVYTNLASPSVSRFIKEHTGL